MADVKLKPCPFCGGKARLVDDGTGEWSVECLRLQCFMTVHTGWNARHVVVRRWNTRKEARRG